ncbi:MAG: DMT family transporter [Hyphomicrobiales bacterium]|nr:DMT family transporter [Hyphomicrobiales bacterium]
MTAIVLKVLSVIVFVAMSTLIKASGELPTGQIAFYRSLFAILPIMVVFAWRRQLLRSFQTRHPFSHVARGVVGVVGMWFSFYGLTRLPLPEAITINYAQPLIVVALSAIFLGELVRVYRWSAVGVGFVGVVIISWPNLTLFSSPEGFGQKQALGAVSLLCAALVSGIAMLLVRRLVKSESSATIVLYFSVTATVMSLITLPFGWPSLTQGQLTCLVFAGICGGLGQILLTESYRHAGMSVIAPFEYTSMILAIAAGYFVFGDIPTAYTIVGGAIVVGAGLFIIWREQHLGLPRGAARKLVPPQ